MTDVTTKPATKVGPPASFLAVCLRRELPVYAGIVGSGWLAYSAMTNLVGDQGLIAVLIVTWAIALTGLNVMQGLGGYPSLAQAGFMGIGAYVSSALLNDGLPMAWAALIAVGVGTVAGLALAVAFSRTRGQYFAIGTLFFAAMITLVINNERALGGPNGMPVNLGFTVETTIALLAGTLVVGLVGFRLIAGSALGARLRGIREDEDLAEHLGVPTARIKLTALVIAATFGTWPGVLLAQFNGVIAPGQFTFVQGFLMLIAIGVGGYGRLFTPIVGAGVVVGLTQLLKLQPGISQIVLGVVFILVTLAAPGGIIGTVEGLWHRIRRQRLVRHDRSGVDA